MERNATADSSNEGERLDATLSQTPLVHVEEKAGKAIEIAEREILDKTAWITHFSQLPYLVEIALTAEWRDFCSSIFKGSSIERICPCTVYLEG